MQLPNHFLTFFTYKNNARLKNNKPMQDLQGKKKQKKMQKQRKQPKEVSTILQANDNINKTKSLTPTRTPCVTYLSSFHASLHTFQFKLITHHTPSCFNSLVNHAVPNLPWTWLILVSPTLFIPPSSTPPPPTYTYSSNPGDNSRAVEKS